MVQVVDLNIVRGPEGRASSWGTDRLCITVNLPHDLPFFGGHR